MAWWKDFLPMIVAIFVAQALSGVLLDMMGFADTNWWVTNWWLRTGLFLAVYLVVYASFVLVTSMLSDDYWAMWTLEPVGTSSPQEPVGG